MATAADVLVGTNSYFEVPDASARVVTPQCFAKGGSCMVREPARVEDARAWLRRHGSIWTPARSSWQTRLFLARPGTHPTLSLAPLVYHDRNSR